MNKRAWAEINLDAVANNIREIRRITKSDSKIMVAVKADAYGHGVLEVTKTLLANGADCLAVAAVQEARQIRNGGINAPILILSGLMEDDCDDLIDLDVMPSVFSYDFAKALSEAAAKKNKTAKIHIKIDTGMTRVGFVADDGDNKDIIDEIEEISKLSNIKIDGIFSHFARSDEKDETFTRKQFARFMCVCEGLTSRGVDIGTRHICNSAGIMMYPEMHLDMVRAGIILYGLYPSDEVDKSRINLIPVMTEKAVITRVKEVAAGREVSYGSTYITDKPTKIATVSIGYADGYLRRLAGKSMMEVNGHTAKVIGRICMDQCMIDVTNVNNINAGDEVTVFGANRVTADSLAEWLETINYEIVCEVSRRIPRIYTSGGKAVKVLEYLQ